MTDMTKERAALLIMTAVATGQDDMIPEEAVGVLGIEKLPELFYRSYIEWNREIFAALLDNNN